MKSIKKFFITIAASLGLCLLMVGNANAATKNVSFYDASKDDLNTVYAKNQDSIYDDVLGLNSYSTDAKVMEFKVGDYEKGLVYNANTSASKYFQFTNKSKSDIKVEVVFAAFDSSAVIKSAAYTFGTETGTTSTSAATTKEITISSNSTAVLWCTSRRTVIYTINYSYEEQAPINSQVEDSIAISAQFDNDTTKTAVRFIVTITTADLSSLSKVELTITMTNTDSAKNLVGTKAYTTVYSTVQGYAATKLDNTYYIVVELTDLATAKAAGYTSITATASLYDTLNAKACTDATLSQAKTL